MKAFKKLIWEWFFGPSPHSVSVQELIRVPAPTRKLEVVLTHISGANIAVFVLKERDSTIGKSPYLYLIHCTGVPTVEWQGPNSIAIRGEFEEFSSSGGTTVTRAGAELSVTLHEGNYVE